MTEPLLHFSQCRIGVDGVLNDGVQYSEKRLRAQVETDSLSTSRQDRRGGEGDRQDVVLEVDRGVCLRKRWRLGGCLSNVKNYLYSAQDKYVYRVEGVKEDAQSSPSITAIGVDEGERKGSGELS